MLDDHAPFAVFNRTANPVVRAVLSSPLHPLLSRKLALITITGRRSGRRYTFPVAYRRDGDRVLINVGWPERKRWWRNLRHAGQVETRIQGTRRTGLAASHSKGWPLRLPTALGCGSASDLPVIVLSPRARGPGEIISCDWLRRT